MWRHRWAVIASIVWALISSGPGFGQESKKAGPAITWKKTVVDKAFRSEGVAVADVNKDGKPDVIVGDVWYEAPDWKMHVIRKDRTFNPATGYSECFGCFADDFNGDGWVDVLILPFPGKECYWYENPGKGRGPWKEHLVSHSACNETPQFADLFGDGKRVLIMGVQPKGQENMGQMFWLRPGKDPTQLWEHHPISEPSEKGKEVPGTFRFSHGLGVGDVNGDGRNDVICTKGWWEQRANRQDDQPWKFHPADLEPACADMFAFDMDGDGKNDIICTSAHQFGMWWHQQKGSKGNPSFVRNDMFPGVALLGQQTHYLLKSREKQVLDLVNTYRATKNLRPVLATSNLCVTARHYLLNNVSTGKGHGIPLPVLPDSTGKGRGPGRPPVLPEEIASLIADGEVEIAVRGSSEGLETVFRGLTQKGPQEQGLTGDWREIGVAALPLGEKGISVCLFLSKRRGPSKNAHVVWHGMRKQLVSQTHALHLVDLNGDGVKDLVTGRRWWAHGPRGDSAPTEPAFLFWFEGRRGKDGIITFLPHLIDDDSGIGTQFSLADINGDGLLDVIVSNKKGVFVFEQVRAFESREQQKKG